MESFATANKRLATEIGGGAIIRSGETRGTEPWGISKGKITSTKREKQRQFAKINNSKFEQKKSTF